MNASKQKGTHHRGDDTFRGDSMKTGWLVINHFLQTNKFTDLYERLSQGARQAGLSLIVKTGSDLLYCLSHGFVIPQEKLPDFVLFWDKDIRLAQTLESMGLKLFNSAKAIALCDDKSQTHMALAGFVSMPKTICAPMTYSGVGYSDVTFVRDAISVLGLPLVIKECFGSFGAQVYLCHTEQEAENKAKELAGQPFIMQSFIAESFGKDLRLQVVGDHVVAAMLRYNEKGDFRAGITGGGSMAPYEPSEEQCALAVSVCKKLGLDFAGVDFLFGKDGEMILCEVNSNAHFKNLYDCTGVNVATKIMNYIATVLEEA